MPGTWNQRGKLRETAFQSYLQHRLKDKQNASHTGPSCGKPTQSNSASIPKFCCGTSKFWTVWSNISIVNTVNHGEGTIRENLSLWHLALILDKGANEFVAFQENLEASFFTKLLLACNSLPTKLIAMLHHEHMELMEWSQMTCCCLRCSTHWSDFHQRALWPSHLTPSQSSPHDFVQLKFFRKTNGKSDQLHFPPFWHFSFPKSTGCLPRTKKSHVIRWGQLGGVINRSPGGFLDSIEIGIPWACS